MSYTSVEFSTFLRVHKGTWTCCFTSLVGAGAFSVIVKLKTSRSFVSSSSRYTGNTCMCLSLRLEKCKAYYVHVAFVCCWDNYVEDWAHYNGSVPSLEHSRNKQKETENGFGAKHKQMHKQGDYSQIGLSRTKLYIEH